MRDSWADRAVRLAQEAGYDDMVAWMRGGQSRWATMQPDPRQAIAFAEAGRRTPGARAQIRARCALREAQAHALANDAASCERCLAGAHALLDLGNGDDEHAWHTVGRHVATRPYVLADEARCWLVLRPLKAIALLEEALRVLAT
jgi:hypothetical protein